MVFRREFVKVDVFFVLASGFFQYAFAMLSRKGFFALATAWRNIERRICGVDSLRGMLKGVLSCLVTWMFFMVAWLFKGECWSND